MVSYISFHNSNKTMEGNRQYLGKGEYWSYCLPCRSDSDCSRTSSSEAGEGGHKRNETRSKERSWDVQGSKTCVTGDTAERTWGGKLREQKMQERMTISPNI